VDDEQLNTNINAKAQACSAVRRTHRDPDPSIRARHLFPWRHSVNIHRAVASVAWRVAPWSPWDLGGCVGRGPWGHVGACWLFPNPATARFLQMGMHLLSDMQTWLLASSASHMACEAQ
jgi:hypothetical protein